MIRWMGIRRLIVLRLGAYSRFMANSERDVEKQYTNAEFASKLRRLADCVESGENFEIQVAGERIYVPDHAIFSIEHEREDGDEELEFQVRWSSAK